ncbi:hypothetical protein O6H91_05G063100 [Diphasiastrum complanatum]|uniref:Uncharacterized protein n=1 Tax=Diphasiastrum complanatum TaxID=34168 RepID=A0ACC2DNZ5_DIPCM|nr:hypothetical protein O6H91_05G063100 [Diphasiastrum complanatum]
MGSSTPTLELTLLAAEDLKNVSLVGKMNPYAVAWVDPYTKRTTRTLKKGGMDPIWNDRMIIPLDNYALANPYACLNVQVFSHGPVWDTIVGSSWLQLSEIWRLRSLKESDEDPDIVTLQLQRPSGRLHGVVRVLICLKGVMFPPRMDAAVQEKNGMEGMNAACEGVPAEGIPVMGYAMPQYSGGYYGAAPYTSASSSQAAANYYPGASASSSFAPYAYVQPSVLPPPVRPPPRRQGNGLLLGLLGGALGAILLGDLIF